MPDVSRPGSSTPSAGPRLPSTAEPDGLAFRVGWGFISLYTLAFMSTSLLFLAPLLVTLALKVNSLVGIEQALSSLAVVTGIAALVAVLPDQVPAAQRGLVSGVLGICVPIASVSGTFLVQLFTGDPLAMFLAPCVIGGFFILLFAVRLNDRRLPRRTSRAGRCENSPAPST
jgi:hypothetical protein